jgi:acetyl-CoA/propionyl-CoA carboxylase carboxyl transferase subunit
MTTLHAVPPTTTVDPRDPEDRLSRFFDAGSMSLLAP